MGKPDPKFSEGARLERKSVRSYLRRLVKSNTDAAVLLVMNAAVEWVLKRQKRYDRKRGGLGKA